MRETIQLNPFIGQKLLTIESMLTVIAADLALQRANETGTTPDQEITEFNKRVDSVYNDLRDTVFNL